MTIWILLALGLHLLYVFTPTLLFIPTEGLIAHGGARDTMPEPSALVGRARRALANWFENLPIFIVLAFLALMAPNADMAMAVMGAKVFILARLVYLPLYLFGIPFVRTFVYLAGFAGNAMMLLALI